MNWPVQTAWTPSLAQVVDAIDPNVPGALTIPELPSQDQAVDYLLNLGASQYGAIMAMLLFACGLVYMLQGWKIFKVLVIANAAVLGGMLGGQVGMMLRGANTWLYTGIAGSLMLAILAGPLMKYAISVMGGLAGAFLGYGLWSYVSTAAGQVDGHQYAWVGALVGLITLGLLAFVILQIVVTVVTSVQGSLMTVAGITALLMMHEPLRASLETPLRSNTHLVALLVGVPAIIGFAFQQTYIAKKAAKKKKPDGGGG